MTDGFWDDVNTAWSNQGLTALSHRLALNCLNPGDKCMLVVSGLASLFSCLKAFQTIEVSDRCFCRELKRASRSFHLLVFPLTFAFFPSHLFGLLIFRDICFIFCIFQHLKQFGHTILHEIVGKKQSFQKLYPFNSFINIALGIHFWLF